MGFLAGSDEIMQYAWVGYRVWKPVAHPPGVSAQLQRVDGMGLRRPPHVHGGQLQRSRPVPELLVRRAGDEPERSEPFDERPPRRPGPRPARGLEPLGATWRRTSGRRPGSSSRAKPRAATTATSPISRSRPESPSSRTRPSASRSCRLRYRRANELQYIGTRSFGGEARYLFGRIEQKTVGLTVRLNYSLTPDLSVQFYGQPFVAAGSYSRFKRITDPKTRDYDRRYHVFGDGEIGLRRGRRILRRRGRGRPPRLRVRESRLQRSWSSARTWSSAGNTFRARPSSSSGPRAGTDSARRAISRSAGTSGTSSTSTPATYSSSSSRTASSSEETGDRRDVPGSRAGDDPALKERCGRDHCAS